MFLIITQKTTFHARRKNFLHFPEKIRITGQKNNFLFEWLLEKISLKNCFLEIDRLPLKNEVY